MIHIIQSDGNVPSGIVGDELQRCGVDQVIVRLYDGDRLPRLSETSAVIVLGGSMGANDDARYPFLSDLKRFLADVVEREIICLGICLGGQLLSAATGGVVTSGAGSEKGSRLVTLTDEGIRDRLFCGLNRNFSSFEWHNDTFSIPHGGVRLAFTETCRNQAFRLGPAAWGLQFHPEVDEAIVRKWSSWVPETAAQSEEFVKAFRNRESDYRNISRRLVANFLEIAGFTI